MRVKCTDRLRVCVCLILFVFEEGEGSLGWGWGGWNVCGLSGVILGASPPLSWELRRRETAESHGESGSL